MVGGEGCRWPLGATSDDPIATEIKAKMFSEPALKPATVDVVSKHGEVTLTGQVPDDAARLAAYKIASETKGVSRVNDQMSVVAAQAEALQPATPATESAPAKRAAKTKASSKAGRTRQAATEAAVGTPAPPPPPQPVTVPVPANTIVTVRTIDSIDSKANQAGGGFNKGKEVNSPWKKGRSFKLKQRLETTYLPGKKSRQRSNADRAPADSNSQNPPPS